MTRLLAVGWLATCGLVACTTTNVFQAAPGPDGGDQAATSASSTTTSGDSSTASQTSTESSTGSEGGTGGVGGAGSTTGGGGDVTASGGGDAGVDSPACPSTCGLSIDGGANGYTECTNAGTCACEDASSIFDTKAICKNAHAWCDPHGGCKAGFCGADPEPTSIPTCQYSGDLGNNKVYCCY